MACFWNDYTRYLIAHDNPLFTKFKNLYFYLFEYNADFTYSPREKQQYTLAAWAIAFYLL